MKLKERKAVVLTMEEVREAVCNLAFKKDPELRNTSELPKVVLINKGQIASTDGPIALFEAEVVLEEREEDVAKNLC